MKNFEEFTNKLMENKIYLSSRMEDILYDIDDLENLNEEYISERIHEIEMIYYYDAAQYLLDNDPSFAECIDIAEEIGYKVDDLNSCTLATLHIHNELEEQLESLDLAKIKKILESCK